MITSRTKRIGLAALLLAGAAVPAIGQDAPESLLPPGFDDPAPAPAPSRAPAPGSAPTAAPIVQPLPGAAEPSNVVADLGNSTVEEVVVDLSKYELPDFAKHSLDRVGVFAAGNGPFPANGFGSAPGPYLETLMRRLDAPVASRWASIVLRRALMSPLDTPQGSNGADFAAERAWVLLRMGEAVAARGLVNEVDTDNYTTRMYQVAMQTALATADPAALCPLADRATQYIHQRAWGLAQAMCMGLAGKPNEAGQLLRSARAGTGASDFDNLLAEKVLGTGVQGRRAVTVEWNAVGQLTAWRWGLATATGVEVPAALYQSAGPQVRYWQALSPRIAPATRVEAAELAATAGVFSSAGLNDLYADIDQQGDAAGTQAAVVRDLRIAYTDSSVSDRMKAIQTLWSQADTPRERYARLILTARAASWIPASAEIEAPERLIASMLSSGFEAAAMQWKPVMKPGTEGWALLALADPTGSGVAYGDFQAFSDGQSQRKAQMLLAGLAGLGRLESDDAARGAQAVDVRIGGVNGWTQAIDGAARRGEAASVALLAGIGMQTRSWDQVTPEALFHIVAAMRAAGMVNYARMIAVEAVTRTA